MDRHHRFARVQQVADAARDADALADVGGRLLEIERRQLAPERHALLQLPERGILEPDGNFSFVAR